MKMLMVLRAKNCSAGWARAVSAATSASAHVSAALWSAVAFAALRVALMDDLPRAACHTIRCRSAKAGSHCATQAGLWDMGPACAGTARNGSAGAGITADRQPQDAAKKRDFLSV